MMAGEYVPCWRGECRVACGYPSACDRTPADPVTGDETRGEAEAELRAMLRTRFPAWKDYMHDEFVDRLNAIYAERDRARDAEARRVVERVVCCLCHTHTATGYVIEKYGNGTFLSCDNTECAGRGEYYELIELRALAEIEEGSP